MNHFALRTCATAILVCGSALALIGCRNWQAPAESPSRLPSVRMRPDSIALEIAIANIEPSDAAQLERLWDELDEQGIALERRRLLDQNGLRCGIAPTQLPAIFRELVDPNNPERKTPPLFAHQQIQNGFGEAHAIEVSGALPQLNWSVIGPEDRTRSGNCLNATCLFELRTFPLGNGTAEIELCPKIRHGTPRPKLATDYDTFTLQPLLEEVVLTEIAFGCRLKPGETLILGPTAQPVGVGEVFLGSHSTESSTVRLLLVRLARTQMDDLFAPQKLQSPLTTAAK